MGTRTLKTLPGAAFQLPPRLCMAKLSFLWNKLSFAARHLWARRGFHLPELPTSKDFSQTKAARTNGSGWFWTPGCCISTAPRHCVATLSFLWKRAVTHSQEPGAKSGILPPKIARAPSTLNLTLTLIFCSTEPGSESGILPLKIVNVGGFLQDKSFHELGLGLALAPGGLL